MQGRYISVNFVSLFCWFVPGMLASVEDDGQERRHGGFDAENPLADSQGLESLGLKGGQFFRCKAAFRADPERGLLLVVDGEGGWAVCVCRLWNSAEKTVGACVFECVCKCDRGFDFRKPWIVRLLGCGDDRFGPVGDCVKIRLGDSETAEDRDDGCRAQLGGSTDDSVDVFAFRGSDEEGYVWLRLWCGNGLEDAAGGCAVPAVVHDIQDGFSMNAMTIEEENVVAGAEAENLESVARFAGGKLDFLTGNRQLWRIEGVHTRGNRRFGEDRESPALRRAAFSILNKA